MVRMIKESTRIPVLGHADGLCAVYVDAAADVDKAVKVVVDGKTTYPAACNATETLLVHRSVLATVRGRCASLGSVAVTPPPNRLLPYAASEAASRFPRVHYLCLACACDCKCRHCQPLEPRC